MTEHAQPLNILVAGIYWSGLDHARGYSKPEIWAKNRAIRKAVKDNRTFWAENGIEKSRTA